MYVMLMDLCLLCVCIVMRARSNNSLIHDNRLIIVAIYRRSQFCYNIFYFITTVRTPEFENIINNYDG